MASLKDLIVLGPARFLDKLYGNLEGNASTATKLATARTINGTSFDGTENITTASWGTARTFALAQDSSGSVSVNGGSNITLKVTNNKMKGYEFISGVSPQVWYTSKVTYTNSTTPTDVWYVKVTINATWVSQLTPMLFEADYSNRSGKLILNLDALPPKWMGYLTDYSGSNIQAIRRVQNSSSKKTEIFVKLAKPTEYNGSTPVGQITVYSPYTIESIVACTATDAGDLIALRNGYNSNTSITTTAQIYGNAATATKLQTARTINGTAFDGTGNITTANWGTTRTITIGATGKSVNGSTNYSWTPYEMRVTRAQYNVGSSMNAIADHGCELGMANLSSTDTTINPGGGTSWHHYINMTWSDCADNNSVTNNEWCTQIANKAGTTDLWVRSRSGSSITDGTAWAAPWTRIVTGSNFTNVLNGTYVNVTGDTMTGDLKFTAKGLHFIPGNTDQYLWKVYSTTDGSFGFRLQYNGTGSGNDNSLSLIADNQEGTEVKAVTILQDGTAVLTVNPQFKTTNYTSTPITIYDDGTTYGHTMLIGAGGTTYIGAGESASGLYSKLAVKSTEDLILGADSNIRFHAGADSATTTNGITLNSSNYFYPQTNNTGSLGTSSYKWASAYATTFYGALNGNASTATAFSSNRTIALTGDVTGSASTNGSSGWSISTAVGNDTHNHTYSTVNLLGSYKSNTTYTSLPTGITYVEMPSTAAVTGDPTYGAMLTVYSSSNRAFQLVGTTSGGLYVRGVHSGNSSDAGTGYSAWNRVVTNSGTWSINISGSSASCTGNAATATALKTARTLTIGSTGKTFNGSANVSWSLSEIGATVSNTWTAGTTAGPTIKTTVNGVAGAAVAIPIASASASGVVTTDGQTLAGAKTFTSNITIKSSTSWSLLQFYNTNLSATGLQLVQYTPVDSAGTAVTSNRLYIRTYSYTSGTKTRLSYYEDFKLPSANASRTSNAAYDILTTKSKVTVAQGGTGAGTAGAGSGQALYNLGLVYATTEPTSPTTGMVWLKPA